MDSFSPIYRGNPTIVLTTDASKRGWGAVVEGDRTGGFFGEEEIYNVNVTIYNLVGQQIKVLVNSNLEYGYHTVTWNGLDQLGRPVASGVYFSELRTRNFRQTKKMLLLK